MSVKKQSEAELKKIVAEGNAASLELRRREVASAHERNVALVGKRFQYRNCYSCPETDADYWWTYYQITKASGERIYCLKFDIDKYGQARIETDQPFITGMGSPCSDEDFDAAWEATLAKLPLPLSR